MQNSSKHLIEIDYLRGLAIFLTLLAHFAFMQQTPAPFYLFIINHIAQFWGGVILFFSISGFVITRSFMNSFEKHNTPDKLDFKFACRLFYMRRFYRIFPTSAFWILLTIIFSITFNEFGSFGALHSVIIQSFAALFFVYNALTPWIVGAALSIFWSLSFEEQFYFIFPFLSRLDLKIKIIILVGIIIFFAFLHRPPDQSRLINSFPLDAISYGVLIAILHQHNIAEKIRPVFLSNKKLSKINFIISILVIILSPILFKKLICGTSILVFAGGWLVFCASYGSGYISPSSTISSFLQKLGKVSFSLYCCHMSAYLITRELSSHLNEAYNLSPIVLNFIAFLVAIILSAVFAICSYFFIEKRTRKLGRERTKKALELNKTYYQNTIVTA